MNILNNIKDDNLTPAEAKVRNEAIANMLIAKQKGDELKAVEYQKQENNTRRPINKITDMTRVQCEKCGKYYAVRLLEDGSYKTDDCDCIFKEQVKQNQEQRSMAQVRQPFINSLPHKYKDAERITMLVKQEQKLQRDELNDYITTFDISKPSNIVMTGASGLGKTHLSVLTVKELITRRAVNSALFISFHDLITYTSSSFDNEKRKEFEQKLEQAKEVDILIFDDIDLSLQLSQAQFNRLFTVVDNRQGRATIYTTNNTSAEMTDTPQKNKIFSRMVDNTKKQVKILKFTGKDLRQITF